MSTRASLVFQDTEAGRVHVLPGDLADRDELAALPADLAAITEVAENAEELRRTVVELIDRRVQVFNPTADGRATGTSHMAYLCENWRLLTAQVMAAVGAAMTARIPEVRFSLPAVDGESVADRQDYAERFFLTCQSVVWTSMLIDWVNGDGVGSLERDLAEHVDRTTLLGDPLLFVPALDGLPRPEPGEAASMDMYRREALRASIYAKLGEPNPVAHQWALAWLHWELRLRCAGGSGVAEVPSLAVSGERLRATISADDAHSAGAALLHQTWEDARNGRTTDAEVLARVKHLQDVFHEVGFGEQLASIFHGIRADCPIEEVADLIIAHVALDASFALPRIFAEALVEARRVDDLARVVDALRAAVPEAEVIDVTLWYYRKLIRMDMPARLIELAGAVPAPEEEQLPVAVQGRLLEVRTHALRSLDRQAEAMALLDSAPRQVLDEPSVKQSLGVIRARLMRDSGSPMAALAQTEALLAEVDDPQPMVYEPLVASLLRLGRYAEATGYARAAHTAALRDRTRWSVGYHAAMVMWCQAMNGVTPDADLFGAVLEESARTDPDRDLVAATALLTNGIPDTDRTRREFVDRARVDLEPVLDRALAERNRPMASRALFVAALYDQIYRPTEALRSWHRVLSVLGDAFGITAGEAILYYAGHLVRAGELVTARAWLRSALVNTAYVGHDSGLGAAAWAGAHTTREIELVTSALFAEPGATLADLRLVGELRRGMVSRSAPFRGDGPAWRRHGIDDDVVAGIAPRSGRVGVLEWVSDGRDPRALLTVVDAAGSVVSATVALPKVDLSQVDKRWRSRLKNWYPGRAGDPFGVNGWSECRAWLARLLDDYLGEDDHLVVIPFAGWRRLPWHTVAFDRVSCSYEPSWVALLSTVDGAPVAAERFREGVVAVPRVRDPAEITDAMARYVAGCGKDVHVVGGVAADRSAVMDLLANAELVTLLTHGYTSSDEHEVALMLAADGSLPLTHAVAASRERGRAHRFGWRDYAELTRSPRVILSAACGTGGGDIVGLGEHLGIYNVMRQTGLRAHVAPHWDIVAADVLPILGEIRSLLLAGEAGLGQCVRKAIRHAIHRGVPPWSALSLILEGDWR
ncbi:CHAT domain-containing protein [Allokutzneria sp. NRRL B-24872]|uniref:CHAT domain-containing protein n=1 Tax=Allokutzneria sp. NRRL B-24872 TaxID=1137961 RepID=UPI00143DB993|nr:CHAT domain-containing protein [Allokutzneria sp. NRRL B-24872]